MDINIADVIKRQVDGYARQHISTAIVAKVVSVAKLTTEQVIDVVPAIDRVYEDNVVLKPSTVYDVPVVFPTGGGGIMTFPITVGDTVMVIYSMRSISDWLDGDGSSVTPIDNRHFHRTDAIAIPGIYTRSTSLSPSTTDVEIKFKNMNITMQPDDTLTLSSNASSITLAPSGDINIAASGDVNITGTNVNLN